MLFSKIKNWLSGFFHFNKQERNGVFVLCVILAFVICLKIFLPFLVDRNNKVELVTLKVEAASSQDVKHVEDQKKHTEASFSEPQNYSQKRFVFNPNTVSEKDAIALGFSKKLSATLINFRNKGGKFFKPEDLKKLYGLSPKLYNELEPYILIPNTRPAFKKDTIYPKHTYEKKTFVKELVEINSADSLKIVYLKGIGPGFTKRIIKYRTLLGGFHSVDQLKEIYGMTDSVYTILVSQISLDKANITKIPVNVIDFNTLKKHPYFNFQSAQALINYRNKHGKLTEADIANLGIFSPEKLKLILPYLLY